MTIDLWHRRFLLKTLVFLFVLVLAGLVTPTFAHAASTHTTRFGETRSGQSVSQVTLTNDRGMRVSILTYGATLTTVSVPDRDGKMANVVLSLPNMASYEASHRRWGGIIGRYAGRIAGARFSLDGIIHNLEAGRNGVTLHGGSRGYDKRLWAVRTRTHPRSVSATFILDSPAADQGFPGALRLEVTYRLMRARNQLRIEYRATTQAPTVVNFTNHAFINLAGASVGTIDDHELTIFPTHFTPTDAFKIPTGNLEPVAGTPLDFRTPAPIGRHMRGNNPLLAPSKGFDHSYAFIDGIAGQARPIAFVRHPKTGRTMQIMTTEPSLVFNTGNGFDGTEVGSEGVAYPIYSGLALETQHLANSPNQPNFPSTRLNPGKVFRSVTTYNFGVD